MGQRNIQASALHKHTGAQECLGVKQRDAAHTTSQLNLLIVSR